MGLKLEKKTTGLLICVALLLLIWMTRLIGIDHFPPFIDETIHIHGGELARNVSLFNDGQIGRQGTFWWMMLFQAYKSSPIWIARVITVLALLPGIAALMATARLAAGYWAAFFFGLLFLFSNYHMFFGRLALADPIAGSAVMVAIYFAARLSRRWHWLDALATGVLLAVGFVAKVNIVPFLGVPLAAVVCLNPAGKVNVRRQAMWLGIALGTALGLIAVFVVGMRLVGQDVLTRSLFLALNGEVSTVKRSLIDVQRILNNMQWTYALISFYLGGIVVAVLVASLVILVVRRQFFVVLCLLGPMLVIWIGIVQESRFLVLPLALLFLAGAIVLATLIRKRGQIIHLVAVSLLVVWGAVQWLPSTVTAINDPYHIPLPAVDVQQYIISNASGTGFPETMQYLEGYPVNDVIGLLMNCQGFRYLALNQKRSYQVDCPTVNLNGSSIADLTKIVNEKRKDGVFVLLQKTDYVPQDIPGKLLSVIDRPNGGSAIYVYQLSAP